jgi:hypothetical protein
MNTLTLYISAYMDINLYDLLSFSGMYLWPTLADVNTRARRLVNAWIKHQKREEQKQVHLLKVSLTPCKIILQPTRNHH